MVIKVIEEPAEVGFEKVALMDLEGTLTLGKRNVPEKANPNHMERILADEEIEGSQEIGYWSGIHLLAGKPPEKYFDRVEKWNKGEIDIDEFENLNLELWNNLLEEKDFENAEKFIEWYDDSSLNLRDKSKKLIDICNEAGCKVGIISHTSTSLSKLAAERLEADFVFPTWSFKYEEDKFARADMEKYAERKEHIVPELREAGVKKIIFFGNGKNDVKIAENSGQAYMINNKQEVNYEALKAFVGTLRRS